LKIFSSKDRHVLHAQGSNIIPTSQVVFQKLIFITCKRLQKGYYVCWNTDCIASVAALRWLVHYFEQFYLW